MKHITAFAAAILFTLFSTAGEAHHSLAATYDLRTTQMVEGTVVLVAYREPHSVVHIMAPDRTGTMQRWSAEWDDVSSLRRQGILPGTLRAGDRVQITGHPGRNPEARQLLIVDITRDADGWSWSEDE